jgi:two-component system, NtrC family, response regulator GlrR
MCQHYAWTALDACHASCLGADLLIAVAAPTERHLTTLIESLRRAQPPLPILFVLQADAESSMLDAAARVADDFVILPMRPGELTRRVMRMLPKAPVDLDRVREKVLKDIATSRLIGRDPEFVTAVAQVPRFARADEPVLITGESGTGKELCARALHQLGPRREHPFVTIDCGAIPDTLFECELFGHTRGAFTGADKARLGLAAVANGGSLFFDEVDALSLSAQAKLLRFLQERTFRPVGSDRICNSDVNVIAASNRDLQGCVEAKTFRLDLFFRINVLRVHLPPLRARPDDIELLARNLLDQAAASSRGTRKVLSRAAVRALSAYAWPGNIRELNNVVRRAAVTCDADLILPKDLSLPTGPSAAAQIPVIPGDFRAARAAVLADFERRYIEDILRKHQGNVTQAAREARQDRRAFGRFIKKYQIDRNAL